MCYTGSIEYEVGEETLYIDYEITPGKPGVPYMSNGEPGEAPVADEIVIEIKNKNGEDVEVDSTTVDFIINRCFEDYEHTKD